MNASSSPPPGDAARWAEACRPFEISASCKATTTNPDDDCLSAVRRVLSAALPDGEVPRVSRACQTIQATCPALPNKITSKVDLDCVDKMAANASGRATGAAVVSWIDSCRNRAIGGCVVVSGTLESDCVNKARSIVSGSFSSRDVAGASRACRTFELRCQ